jgi:hypothetical protein
MLSHVTRANSVRERSLQQLATAGITPTVIESTVTTPGDTEVKRQAWHALSLGADNPHGVMFFEDDILVDAHRMLWFLTGPVPTHDLVALCLLRLKLYPLEAVRVMAGRVPTTTSIIPIEREAFRSDRGFHGTMGIWLSAQLVATALANKNEFMLDDGGLLSEPVTPSEMARGKPCGFDFWLKDRAQRPAVLFPNAIDHQPAVRSTISGSVRTIQSPAFGLPSVGIA